MTLKNKLGITNEAELARQEERISKKKALQLFENGDLDRMQSGTFSTLAAIHKYLFEDIFAPVMYLGVSLENIEKMPQSTFDEIVEKYVEMNVAHPFREGNGRSTRIWLDLIFKQELGLVVVWSKFVKNDYLMAMERSPVKSIEIKHILKQALTDKINDREVYMKGIDASYHYEGYSLYKTEDIAKTKAKAKPQALSMEEWQANIAKAKKENKTTKTHTLPQKEKDR